MISIWFIKAITSSYLLEGGIQSAIANVVKDGVVEQHGVLRHDADALSHTLLGVILDVEAIQQHSPVQRIVETKQQPRDGGLT